MSEYFIVPPPFRNFVGVKNGEIRELMENAGFVPGTAKQKKCYIEGE